MARRHLGCELDVCKMCNSYMYICVGRVAFVQLVNGLTYMGNDSTVVKWTIIILVPCLLTMP